MNTYAFLLSATLFLSSSAIAAEISEAQKTQISDFIKDKMRDPDSTKFEWNRSIVDIAPNGFGQVCVPVNSKNGFGGYSGFQIAWLQFYVGKDQKLLSFSVLGIGGKRVESSCLEIAANIERMTHHDPRITDDQARAGCSILDGKLFCAGPGTGLCWEEGHDPWKGETPSQAVDAERHFERCSKNP